MASQKQQYTILYGRLSQEDERAGESNSIQHQELICKGWFLPPNTYDCGSFVVNGTALIKTVSMQETERRPMKKDWEIYRDTGILGGYIPEQAKLRRTEDGEVTTVFRDTVTHEEEDCIAKQREMLIGGRRFCITSVFPAEPCATPTDKLIACIDAELEKEARSA